MWVGHQFTANPTAGGASPISAGSAVPAPERHGMCCAVGHVDRQRGVGAGGGCPLQPAWGSGAAGSLSWPDRIAGWWVHRSGCHPDRAVPAAPRASQRPPLTVSDRSRSASSDVHCPSMLRFRSANPCGSHTAIAPSARGPVDQSGWVRAARGRSGSVQPALDVRLHQAGADPTGGAGHRRTGRPGQHRTQFQVGHLR
jgi:hypothetical protein